MGFQFKQFYVAHSDVAMKVGTDGILLGAWADVQSAQSVLDIGAGSGLISLMLKQRSPFISITAIEVDAKAALQAQSNIAHSQWPDIKVIEHDILTYTSAQPFDLVVSNPPFFQRSLKGPNEARNTARHTDSLSFAGLFDAFNRLSTLDAKLALVLPAESLDQISTLVTKYGFCLSRITYVKTTLTKPAKRVLIEVSKLKQICLESELIIHQGDGYHPDYIKLCKDFYLKM